MTRRSSGAGSAIVLAALLLSACGLAPYQEVRYETMLVSGEGAELSSVVTLTPVEDEGAPADAVTTSFVVDDAQLVVQAQPGAPAATIEGIEFEYFWADGTEIPVEGTYRVKLNLYVPAGFECEGDCFGEVDRLPTRGEEVSSQPFPGMPFAVAERLYFGSRAADNAYAIATVHAYAGARDVSFETEPIALVQEVVQE